MNKEQHESYSKFIAEPGIDGPKIFDELWNTPLVQEYDPTLWDSMTEKVHSSNSKIPLVYMEVIKKIKTEAEKFGMDRVDSLYQAVSFCLNPANSSLISSRLGIDEDELIAAASHIGVAEIAELYQTHDEKNEQKMHLLALYFAGAQAKVLGFQTSTTLLAMDLKDEGYLRLDNIAIITEEGDENDLGKAHGSFLLEGKKVSQIKTFGGRKGFTF